MRINKYIAETGICSRREADRLIESGKVTINGVVAMLGSVVNDTDIILINGQEFVPKKKDIYIALNKPIGITSTTDRTIKGNIVDFVNHSERIFHIGRLDKDSQGLILLTNNGDIVNKILRAENNHEKEYTVTVDKNITDDFLSKMSRGVPIMDTITKPCKVNRINNTTFRIILTQGLNRQIRRMCKALGYRVLFLERIRIMNIKLGNLPLGQWRNLTKEEIDELMKQIN